MRRVRPPFFNEGKEYYRFSMDNYFYNNLALHFVIHFDYMLQNRVERNKCFYTSNDFITSARYNLRTLELMRLIMT